LKVSGDVPVARGLGSSVTVRLGILAGLNALDGRRLNEDQLLELTAALEGHPDNAAPALVGGFVVSTTGKRDQAVHFVRAPVDSRLRFILLIPNLPIQTRRARQVLPRVYRREDAVHNLGRACLLTAALLRKDYPALWEAVDDRLHQPYRSKLFQPLYPVLKAARKSGAMAGWLSGSGSALCLVTMGGAGRLIGLLRRKIPAVRRWKIHVVRADNRGLRVR
jgi:homoserine kinase